MTSRRRYLILKNFLSIRSLPNTKWGWCKRLGLVKSQLNKLYHHNKAETYIWKFLKFPSDISSVCQANVNKLCTAIYEPQILNTQKLHIVINQLPIIKLWKAATYVQLKSFVKKITKAVIPIKAYSLPTVNQAIYLVETDVEANIVSD